MRGLFDPFTTRHCPGCAAPCCIKPTRVTPVDVALAVNTGHRFPQAVGDPFAPALSDAASRLSSDAVSLPVVGQSAVKSPSSEPSSSEFCEFLIDGRCSFPNDLRPFGCTTYLCRPMYAHLPEETLRRLRRLSRQLGDAHTALLRTLKSAGDTSSDKYR